MAQRDANEPKAYGRAIAADYDAMYDDTLDTDAAVDCLAGLADGGPVLELGVGTGRLALPLAQGGLAVHGVESSAEAQRMTTTKVRLGADGIACIPPTTGTPGPPSSISWPDSRACG